MTAGRLALLACTLLAPPAHAFGPREPYSYVQELPERDLVWVMYTPADVARRPAERKAVYVRPDGSRYWPELRAPAGYPASGLYPAGSKTPLWTVDWWCDPRDGAPLLAPSLDPAARFAVRESRSYATSRTDIAVAFYDRGRLLRSYTMAELVTADLAIRRGSNSIVPVYYGWRLSSSLDRRAGVYTLETIHLDRHLFDARTGALVSSSRPLSWAVLLVVVSSLAGCSLRYRWRRGRWPEPVAWFVQAGLLACAAALL